MVRIYNKTVVRWQQLCYWFHGGLEFWPTTGNALRDSEEALLKKITVANYRQDPYYAPIVRAVEGLLREKGFVAPVELFIRMNLLSPESAEDWRRGQISYLERAYAAI
jgi:hypothetical protein